MAAIRVAQLARIIVVFGEEERSVIPLGRVFVKQPIHRLKKSFGLPSRLKVDCCSLPLPIDNFLGGMVKARLDMAYSRGHAEAFR